MFLILYFTVALVVMYIEAMRCYNDKAKFNILHEVIFSILWIITLPLTIYTVIKMSTEGYKT